MQAPLFPPSCEHCPGCALTPNDIGDAESPGLEYTSDILGGLGQALSLSLSFPLCYMETGNHAQLSPRLFGGVTES